MRYQRAADPILLSAAYGSLLLVSLMPRALSGQEPWARVAARAVPLYTRAEPIPGGGSLAELRVVQPVVMLRAGALGGHLLFHGTLNLEGQTIPQGELAPGNWGEGFNDRRHPHTYLHELILSGADLLGRLDGPVSISLSAGKGFAPFGTDDPMNRPAVRYPVNHHYSQILERAVGIVGVAAGPLVLEGGLFNGDEPERPGQWPLVKAGGAWRFGDSWSVRGVLRPLRGLELQGSRAKVHSPEHRPGAGTDNYKWNVSARLDRSVGGARAYGLIEWARTSEAEGFFVFHTVLAEGAWSVGSHRPYYRFERTERPEDARTLDLFRSVRPHLENSIVGATRWTIHTLGYRLTLHFGPPALRVEPFTEGSFAHVTNANGGLLDPKSFYGKDHVWSVSAGVRLGWGADHRMGRYGVLSEADHGMASHHH